MVVAMVMLAWMGRQPQGAEKPAEDDKDVVYRFDLATVKPVPVALAEMKPGCVYSHHCPRLNKRVWSYLQEDGKFWEAFGPGTVQQPQQFDPRLGRDEGLRRLREYAPSLAEKLTQQGGTVSFRLNPLDQWELDTSGDCATCIYNKETGQRWERVFGRYVPVVSTCTDRWVRKDNRFLPTAVFTGQGICVATADGSLPGPAGCLCGQ